MRMKIVITLAAVVLMFAAKTSAHHAFAAEFDSNKPIKLRGTVVKMEWINPHTWIHLDVKTPKGTVERWMIEGGPPNALYRRGVTKDSLPNGVEILGRRVSREGWIAEREWTGPDVCRRAPPVRGFFRHRRATRRPGQDREVTRRAR